MKHTLNTPMIHRILKLTSLLARLGRSHPVGKISSNMIGLSKKDVAITSSLLRITL